MRRSKGLKMISLGWVWCFDELMLQMLWIELGASLVLEDKVQ
jgi:hypothetical protein